MAAVFLMQPLGQLAVSAMSLLTLVTISRPPGLTMEKYHAVDFIAVDHMWRLVVAAGAVPAFITFIFRFTIPDSPRYTFEVDNTHCLRSQSYEVQSIAIVSTSHCEVECTFTEI
jgi:MFS transporter, PHS family, inorganic phosphate transporter